MTRNEIDKIIVQTLSPIIKAKRKVLGLTQDDLGNALEKERSTYSRIENGELNPSLTNFLMICKSLGLNPAEIITNIYKQLW